MPKTDLDALMNMPPVRNGGPLMEGFHPGTSEPEAGPSSLEEARGVKWEGVKSAASALKDMVDRLRTAAGRQDEQAIKLAVTFQLTTLVSLLNAMGKRQAAQRMQRAAMAVGKDIGLVTEDLNKVASMTEQLLEAVAEPLDEAVNLGNVDRTFLPNHVASALLTGPAYKSGKVTFTPSQDLTGQEQKLAGEVSNELAHVSLWNSALNQWHPADVKRAVLKAKNVLGRKKVTVKPKGSGWEVSISPPMAKLDKDILAVLPSDVALTQNISQAIQKRMRGA